MLPSLPWLSRGDEDRVLLRSVQVSADHFTVKITENLPRRSRDRLASLWLRVTIAAMILQLSRLQRQTARSKTCRLSARHHTWTAVGVTQLGVCCLVIICGNHTVVLLDHMGSTCRQRAGPETDGALMYPSTRELRTNAEPAAMYMSAECAMFAAKPV